MTDRICVGAIAGAYGVKGELRIKSFCATPEDIENYTPLWSEDGSRQFALAILRPIKNGFSARIADVATKEEADALRGVNLFADRNQMPSLPDDEFYHADLIDLEVYDTGGVLLGRVKTVQNHGADDLLELQLAGTSATTFLPFTKAAVPTVDLTAGRIVADPPLGILPETDKD
ncbi:16S rRNA processing protein RimM [Sulfitobacter mediterraneus]|jgi:16S rRNA processing protein RimM|uniref:ribosome maturation factor RimM n=1 Tax=Sulfitobacter TaxID=60136 RepID=UPI001932AC77|nr:MULTISPECIES: ribosome maturation factor RimM [Sulfitobacter]MBM1633375.1 16S rRNA processing protein RimM [Sulfitobacter mediterraneus]MBM1640491.1 16S rRNA processing protein RimM [Sulfitobacter mediterraneus]MBM1645240.1 16S rRNA processing protein RimM [Sulfitobacter mediterraneus]MBM1648611.1 16S rRNA processing protein RimM [Sulfitobacter mediterraneus]MBM1652632.1 16S rRNA processing protein RimM [Sulfitobacter mediterraneus]